MIESAISQYTREIQTIEAIRDVFNKDLSDMTRVYFDDLYWLDEHGTRVDTIKLFYSVNSKDLSVETESVGSSVSQSLNRCDLVTLTLIYLRLQKMLREFKSTEKKFRKTKKTKRSCCGSSPECYNCPEKKSH